MPVFSQQSQMIQSVMQMNQKRPDSGHQWLINKINYARVGQINLYIENNHTN